MSACLMPAPTIPWRSRLPLSSLPRASEPFSVAAAAPGRAVRKVGDLEIDRVAHAVQRGGQPIELSPKEFALLEFLMRHEGQAVTRTAIVEQVWKLNFDTMTNVVDVYINYLRRKVDSGHERALIRTVRGVGYQIGGQAAHN